MTDGCRASGRATEAAAYYMETGCTLREAAAVAGVGIERFREILMRRYRGAARMLGVDVRHERQKRITLPDWRS